jgi:GNAT superfamily N-acetyltransferase
MGPDSLTISSFLLRVGSDADYKALSQLYSRLHTERDPDDPPTPLEKLIQQWRSLPDFVEAFVWVVRQDASPELIASARADLVRMEENKHLMQIRIGVLPESRRQGIARRLLTCVVETAERENRRMLIMDTTARIPAGEAFMQRLGAQKGLEAHTNQLKMSDLNRDLVCAWIERASERASGFELGFWDGAYPEEQIEAIAALHEVMNTQPYGSLEVEDFHFTPEHLRQMEQALFASGGERWTLYVREKATGAFAGFTDIFWNPNRPELLQQGGTGVFPAYRNRGLGRWLKAAMLEKVMQDRPQVRLIRTGNADSNAAMLGINRELGFQPYESQAIWQIETEQARRYLEKAVAQVSQVSQV